MKTHLTNFDRAENTVVTTTTKAIIYFGSRHEDLVEIKRIFPTIACPGCKSAIRKQFSHFVQPRCFGCQRKAIFESVYVLYKDERREHTAAPVSVRDVRAVRLLLEDIHEHSDWWLGDSVVYSDLVLLFLPGMLANVARAISLSGRDEREFGYQSFTYAMMFRDKHRSINATARAASDEISVTFWEAGIVCATKSDKRHEALDFLSKLAEDERAKGDVGTYSELETMAIAENDGTFSDSNNLDTGNGLCVRHDVQFQMLQICFNKEENDRANMCANCGKTEEELLRCSRCSNMFYCSKACQRTDWKQHKRSECRSKADADASEH